VSLLDMLRRHGFFLFWVAKQVIGFEERLTAINDLTPKLSDSTRNGINKDFPFLQKYCESLGLHSVVDQMGRVLTAVKDETCTYQNLRDLVPDLTNRLNDDLKRTAFLYVPPARVQFYLDAPQFGQEVADKFPKSVEDIQEAAKCFALARYTATVFHLMRVMEGATQYLGKRLGISLVGEKNWHNILDEVDKAIKAHPAKNSYQKAKRNKLAEASAHLRMVKDAWRNDVMHPKETYTEDEADRVFRNVKDFMVHLATKL
jgi:hypothetical protein